MDNDSNGKCDQCKKAPGMIHWTKIELDMFCYIYVVSSRKEIRPEIHRALCEFMEKIGKTIVGNMLWGKPGEIEGDEQVEN